MKRAIILQHAPFEGPARIAPMLVARGYALDARETYRGDAVPSRLAPGELLVVMGGPMGVGDRLPYLEQEVGLLRRCIADDAPVLGICLGAQLLAHAAGAHVAPMTRDGARVYEVGWAPLTLIDDPILRGVPRDPYVLHWHGDRFELPAGARHLASTPTCREQAFQLGRQVGLQFHVEVDTDEVEAFLEHDAAYVEQASGAGAIERLRRDTETYLPAARLVGDRLLGNILDAIGA